MSFLLHVFIINLLVISPCPYLPVFIYTIIGETLTSNTHRAIISEYWASFLRLRNITNKSEPSNHTANGDLAIKSGFVNVVSSAILNRPRSIYQYSNMAPRLSGQNSIFGVVFFVSKSLLGIERQKKLEKFAILTRKPRSYARVLIYRTWPILRRVPLYTRSQTPVPRSPFPVPRSPFPVPSFSNIPGRVTIKNKNIFLRLRCFENEELTAAEANFFISENLLPQQILLLARTNGKIFRETAFL